MKQNELLREMIAQGEHEHQDFKFQITDARKIARSISAFANNSGGRLLIGVKDNGVVAGVRSDEEMYMVEQAAQLYCQPAQPVQFTLFHIDGKSVLMAEVAESDRKPVKAPDDAGNWKTYYRVADENILASAMHVKMLLRDSACDEPRVLHYTDRERLVLDYLQEHGGITLGGIVRLVHCSRNTAERLAVSLHDMGVVDVKYHDGACMITSSHDTP